MSRALPLSLVLALVFGTACSDAASTNSSTPMQKPADTRHVIVNGAELDSKALAALDQVARTRVPDGDYWYDARCGACGAKGGPTAAFLPASLAFAPMKADASGGGSGRATGVFVNGRELHLADCQALSRLGAILPGRYWLDANGNWGVEGTDVPLGNLVQAASAMSPTGPGYNRSTLGGHLMSDGQTSGWFDPKSGASVLVGG